MQAKIIVNDGIVMGKNNSMLYSTSYMIFKTLLALLTKEKDLNLSLTAVNLEITTNVSLSWN